MPDAIYKIAPIPTMGLNTDAEPTKFDDAYSPYMKNAIVETTRVRKRRGYSQLGGDGLPLDGIGMELINYRDATGDTHLIAITNTKAYLYDSTNDTWDEITPTTVLDGCESGWAPGSGNVSVGYIDTVPYFVRGLRSTIAIVVSELSDGDLIAYKDISATNISSRTHISFWIRSTYGLDAGALEVVVSESNHASGEKTGTYVECETPALTADTWTQVTIEKSLSSFNSVISVSLFANATIAAANVFFLDAISADTCFTGGVDNRFSNCIVTDDEEFPNNGGAALLISNGVDDVYAYEGDSGDKFVVLSHLFPSFGNVKEIEEFWNHLFFINYNDGANQVRALAFADVGNVDTWSEGTSGSNVLTDTRGDLLRAKKLGPYMILYSEKSITVCKYYGGDTIFSFPTLVYETGLFAAKAVWDFVNVHYLLGTDQKIYGYYGGSDLLPIGERIEQSLFDDIDVSKKAKIVTGLDIGRHKVIFFVPRSGDTYPQVGYALSYIRKGLPWEYYEFADTIRDFSTFENYFAWYCDDDDKTDLYCDEQSFYCDDSYGQTDYPMAVFLTHDGYVMKMDEATGKDDDADIVFELWSPEFVVDDEETFGRWLWVSFTAMSGVANSTISVLYSTDSGTTWTALADSPVSLDTDWKTHRLPLTVLSRRIMFKIYQDSSKDVQLRGNFRCQVDPQSEMD